MKIKVIFSVAFCVSLMLMGCKNEIPNLTMEQNEKISGYVDGLLMKYDENHDSRLLNDKELELELERLETLYERKKEMNEQSEIEEEVPETNEGDFDKENDTVEISEEVGIYAEEFYGIDDVTIRYQGFEIAEQYPANGDGLYFMMKSNEGKKLLVLKFLVMNHSEEELELDMISLKSRFLIGINGETPEYALSTLLSDDISNYKGKLSGGETTELVLIAEVTNELSDKIEKVSVIMKKENESEEMNLE